MSTPQMTDAESRAHQVFTTLMWAQSYPGKRIRLPQVGLAAFAAIGEALVDLETSVYTSNPELTAILLRTGARTRSPDAAMYQFYTQMDEQELAVIAEAPTGNYLYPDQSATLVLGCTFADGEHLHLSGPGIASTGELVVGQIPASFWELRQQACRFPLGWDIVLLDADGHVVGLPRTTRIEVL